ncbi:MAG TPA: SpoIIE family protein phosphatase [Actinomycetota bacterium]|nr:SpoIIE family protein phosphatase [Actinomycetota bacterium]
MNSLIMALKVDAVASSDESPFIPRGIGGQLTDLRSMLPKGQMLPARTWEARHRGILVLLWFHVVLVPIFATVRGFSVLHAVLEGSAVGIPAAIATAPRLGRRLRTVAASIGILSASGVLVHLSGGLIEMHFHFFVMVTVVALYQDWIPFLVAIGYVLVHHGLVGVIDPRSVFNHQAAIDKPWTWAGIHAFFIAGISVVCLVTWRLNESLLSSRTRAEKERAELYESEKVARGQAERAQQRLTLLAEASQRMISSLDSNKTLQDVAELTVPALADICLVDVIEEDSTIRRWAAVDGIDRNGAIAGSMRDEALDLSDSMNPIVEVLRTGVSRVMEEMPTPEIAHALVGVVASAGVVPTSAIIVPLEGHKGILGSISFFTVAESGRALEPEDLPLASELGRRAGTALENSRLYARERTVAETLQRSLLPVHLPEIPGLESGARYLPGGPGVEVGGDWYDVFLLPGGSVGIAMGDVMGRGIPAASLMGQLRNALRAFAYDNLPPAEILQKLHRLVQADESEYLATAVYATWDPDDGTLRMANAAHPPPLLVTGSGNRFVKEATSAPLGAIPHITFEETAFALIEGDTLILYTDGLVEDRNTALDAGLGHLMKAVESGPSNVDQLSGWIVSETLRDRVTDDDVAVLVIRPSQSTTRISLNVPADPRMLAPLRSTLRRWLTRNGIGPDATYGILLACGEACANAIEHGSKPYTGHFQLEALAEEGELRIAVKDEGTWRPNRPTEGGRGIGIMESFAKHLDLTKTPEGTTVTLSWSDEVFR